MHNLKSTVDAGALAPVMNRSVRSVVNGADAIGEALCRIAAGAKREWTLTEWYTKLAELQVCKLKVRDWIMLQ